MLINQPSDKLISISEVEPNEFVQFGDEGIALIVCDQGNYYGCAADYITVYYIEGAGLATVHKDTLCIPLNTVINFTYKENK